MLPEIAPATDARLLPACTPSLMPFHISYTGPAPVSRYFRPRPAPQSLVAPSVYSSSSAILEASSSSASILSDTQSSLTAVSSATSIGSLAHDSECGDELRYSIELADQVQQAIAARLAMDTATGMDVETQPAIAAVPLDNLSSARTPAPKNAERFVATFRGRQMYGQAVGMPSGYGGLVLRPPSDSKGKGNGVAGAAAAPLSQRPKPKSKMRAAMRQGVDIEDRHDRGDNEDRYPDSDIEPLPQAKKLVPWSTFTSFMLWTPDRPLDVGRDEYARALVEWTRLATEIHSYDE